MSEFVPNADWNEALARSLAEQLHALYEFSARHRRNLDQAEEKLAAQVAALVEDLVSQRLDEAVRTAAASAADSKEAEEMRGRYRLCLEDIRQLKQRCAELEEDLAEARQAQAASAASAGAAGGKFSWEEQKRRLLAALESDFSGPDPQRRDDRLTVEGAIHITDSVVQEKDREIAELKKQLAARAEPVVVDSAQQAIESVLEADEIIREERARLQALEAELESKLRSAEIELSQQRARLARELMEVEEQRRNQQQQTQSGSTPPAAAGKPRGRWLTRLGLKDDEE